MGHSHSEARRARRTKNGLVAAPHPIELNGDERYLGDGLYAAVDRGMIRLRAPRGSDDHFVFLDPELFRGLMRFAKEAGWVRDGN
jgi:hypothetical protein